MIDIAIPKGSLQNQTLQLFEQAGLEVKRTEREYNARIEDPRIGKVKWSLGPSWPMWQILTTESRGRA